MTTINEGRVLAALHAGGTPLSVQGMEAITHLEGKVVRKSLASLARSGLVEQTDTEPEQTWKLTARARRWLETAIGRAAVDVPSVRTGTSLSGPGPKHPVVRLLGKR
ncbi:hypothetical protein [Nocardia sp. XZ_19_385]|uniref:hypothetical protein n=1 Tax=Nocardia sp. XZ_19_385 TaxID=2769488 RepID=UPI0018902131|nr:hypothetical protein [Nocardia sp. XZ_19_385]